MRLPRRGTIRRATGSLSRDPEIGFLMSWAGTIDQSSSVLHSPQDAKIGVPAVAPAIVVVYLVVLGASQYTSWDGVDTWVRQHAFLVPVPFVGL